MKKALIFGISGQDGSYLSELLLSKNYSVHGVLRRSSTPNSGRIDHIFNKLSLHYGDLEDGSSLRQLLEKIQPDEIYNLGAQSHVRTSFDIPEYTLGVTGMGTLRLLEAIVVTRMEGNVKYYQASSSEMFGAELPPQNELTHFRPRSPYGIAKVTAYWLTANYRERYGMFVTNGILFNHESPRRGETFVTRKITKAVARILLGLQKYVTLGNLDAQRDWGYAPEYVEAMWKMTQYARPRDFVIATGETHSVREFLQEAFNYVGLDWEKYVKIDPKYFRPTEVDILCGDSSVARKLLNWEPKVNFKQLIRIMVDADIKLALKESNE